MTVRKLLRDPLVHFLGIGLLLFALYGLVAPADTGGARIVITQAMVDDMAAQHRKLWNRDPTPAELKQLVDARVADEILYREGLSMGLDRDDAVIKRRVRQKYDLIAEEADSVVPTDADLEAYLKANPDRFRSAPIVSFRQVLLPTEGGEADVRARVTEALAALGGGVDPATVGKASLLPALVSAQALDLVARDFGEPFAAALARAPEGQWVGPVASAYGLHLVRIDRRIPADVPPLAGIRRDVQREWENDRRLKARAERLEELRGAYRIEIEGAPGS